MQREGLWAIILAKMTPIHQSPDPASRTAHVPDGCRVYAIGDIHGRADLLRRLHLQIMEDAANAASLRKVVVYVGDYVDRGPESATVINMLINEPLGGFEVHHLKGNHESMMIDFLETGEGDMWMMNGAKDTLASYGLDVLDLRPFQSDFNGLSGVLEKALPDNHRAFLDGLELFYLEGDYIFAHAGLKPGVALEDQSERDITWIRDEFTETDADFGAIVVHGHTIRDQPQIRPNRIGIDTGAWHSNHLTALVLETDTRRFLQT